MVDLPSEIVTGPYVYTVSSDPIRCKERSIGRDLFRAGETNHPELTVTVASDLPDAQFKDTVLHEWLHTIWRTFHLPPEDDVKEEAIIKRLATVLLDGMRRNPQLVAFLMEAS